VTEPGSRQCSYDGGHSMPPGLRKHPMPKRLIIPGVGNPSSMRLEATIMSVIATLIEPRRVTRVFFDCRDVAPDLADRQCLEKAIEQWCRACPSSSSRA
jgi:hypothetical protein